MKNAIVLLPFLLFFWGCNPYSQFYQDCTRGKDILWDESRVIISTDEPKLRQGFDPEADAKHMVENGYCLIGQSCFNAGEISRDAAVEQAKKVHADTVIVYSQYTNTISGSMPSTMPNTQTSYHSGSIYGSGGGFANYSGSSTTYGTQTTYMPYSIRRYDYYASFWVKVKPGRLGIFLDNLTDELRKKIESNKGIYVVAVVKGSPAFNNDILTGDIIRKINDIEVIDTMHVNNILREYKEKEIKLEIFRDGKTITKQIQLN
ncbi:MAG: PDZ domain-containing protein [Sedimentisphaerales bacterium]